MLRCDNCGHVFDEENEDCIHSALVESYNGYKLYENYYVCPECNSEDITEFSFRYKECADKFEDEKCTGKCGDCKFAEQKEAEENDS